MAKGGDRSATARPFAREFCRSRRTAPDWTRAIMCVGVDTANSILLVSLCLPKNERRFMGVSSRHGSGSTRIGPVIVTPLAMIIGMIPTVLGLGEASEQNAPLGRAAIGGLLFAMLATLFVPIVFTLIHG